ncbi:hypothetical protein HJFPF1_02690 [Paramyrothecium foliicola]|nr:hypothetical protein HJFPF1_02690 [Paramyrothecium foliicola]
MHMTRLGAFIMAICGDGYTCSTKWREFDADPDVVIASFLIAAWFTFSIALFAYIFIGDALNNKDGSLNQRITNDLDEFIINTCKELQTIVIESVVPQCLIDLAKRRPQWLRRLTKKRLEPFCLALADQQLIISAAILLVGFSRHCEITEYHFLIVWHLAQSSSGAFLSVLLLAYPSLDTHFKKGWRFLWITAFYCCIMASSLVVYNSNIEVVFGNPIGCTWELVGQGQGFIDLSIIYIIFSFLVNLWSYGYSMTIFYPQVWEVPVLGDLLLLPFNLMDLLTLLYWYVKSFREQHSNGWMAPHLRLFEALTLLWFAICFTIHEIIWSLYFGLALIFAALTESTWRIQNLRDNAPMLGRVGNEDEWGFGQVLPMLLLAIALLAFLEIVISKMPVAHLFAHGGS